MIGTIRAYLVFILVSASSLALGAVGKGREVLDPTVASHTKVQGLMSRHYIFASSSGTVDIAYANVARTICRSNLLAAVQEEYSKMLPAGQKPEFTVEDRGSNTYYYVNDNGEHSWLEEIQMGETRNGAIVVAFHVAGNRFFGDFESLIQVDVTPSGDDRCRYDAHVFAYPQSKVVRFFCRHLGIVERYFRNKTADMTELVKKISLSMIEGEEQKISLAEMEQRKAMGTGDKD